MEPIVIRLLKDQDIPKINALYQKAYNVHRPDEKFRWEFQNGPAGPAIYVVAIDPGTDQVVGTQCAIPLYVTNASGQRILTAKSEDTLVDTAYRGRNIFEKMYALLFDECRKAGVVAIWGFTYAIKPFSKLGFEIPFHCNFGLIAFKAAGAYKYFEGLKQKRSVVEKSKIAGLVAASRVKYMAHIGSVATDGYRISNDVQENLDDLTPSQPQGFFLLHDSKFLGWRVRTNPYPNGHLYYSLGDDTGRRVATIVCSHTSEVSYIMHMAFARNLSQETKQRLLNAVIRDMSGRTNVIRFWGFTHNETGREEIDLLKQSGFIFTNQGISFVWKKLDETSTLAVNNFVLSRTAAQGT
jgi:hypothetical protein